MTTPSVRTAWTGTGWPESHPLVQPARSGQDASTSGEIPHARGKKAQIFFWERGDTRGCANEPHARCLGPDPVSPQGLQSRFGALSAPSLHVLHEGQTKLAGSASTCKGRGVARRGLRRRPGAARDIAYRAGGNICAIGIRRSPGGWGRLQAAQGAARWPRRPCPAPREGRFSCGLTGAKLRFAREMPPGAPSRRASRRAPRRTFLRASRRRPGHRTSPPSGRPSAGRHG